jgi:hypothetical protein
VRKNRPRFWLIVIGAAAVIGGAVVSTYVARQSSNAPAVASQGPTIEVYKDPTCGCCAKWVEHLQAHGFTAHMTNSRDVASVKASHGVPRQVQSCHTAIVDGYVVEGHVPAADVRRLLTERPAIAGLAVPGMPVGSPGMEMPGARAQAYEVLAFDRSGNTHVFARH